MSLTVPGEVVLLCMDDHSGKCVSPYADYAFNGAVIAELVLLGRVSAADDSLRLIDSRPTADPILDEALCRIARRERKLHEWIGVCMVEHGREKLLKQLVELGILERVESKVLGIFTFRRYPAHGGQMEEAIRNRLRGILLGNAVPTERDRMLLSVIYGAGLLKGFIHRPECRTAQARADELVAGEPVGAALRQVIRADEDTAAAAVMVSAIT